MLAKRAFDLAITLILIPGAFVLCGIAAIPIAVEARTNPFFLQWRIGQNEKPFRILKIRTMRTDTPTMASHAVGQEFILKAGRIVRMTKIDELPQLWNILCGQMSLVGPRPCLPSQLELIHERRARSIFNLKPGVTGLSQIRGIDMSTPAALAQSDSEYLQSWSLLSDLKILCLTAVGKGRGDAARS